MNTSTTLAAALLVSFGTLAVAGCGSDPAPERKGGTTSHLEGDVEADGETPAADPPAEEAAPAEASEDAVASADTSQDAASKSDEDAPPKNDEVAAGPAIPIVIGVLILACATISITCPAAAAVSCGSGNLKSQSGTCEISKQNGAKITCTYECKTSEG